MFFIKTNINAQLMQLIYCVQIFPKLRKKHEYIKVRLIKEELSIKFI